MGAKCDPGSPGVQPRRLASASRVGALALAAALAMGHYGWAQMYPALPAPAGPNFPSTACSDQGAATLCNPVTPVANPELDYTKSNYANSPELAKFIDALPSIPVATPDKNKYAGSDYYEISLRDYQQRMHSSLPAPGTHLRGYIQTNGGGQTTPNYMGPLIVAKRGTPVRIKFTNELNKPFFLPVDSTVMGAGYGPPIHTTDNPGGNPAWAKGDICTATQATTPGNDCANGTYSTNRAELHLHGGDAPWISDGTPHQWITPAKSVGGDPSIYKKGVSFRNAPDMAAGATPDDGVATYYYPNTESGRLMFYHDHSYGITRLNVYAGEAAGYLLTDDNEIALTKTGGAMALAGVDEGTPLIIQDKTFVRVGANDPFDVLKVDPLWIHYGFNAGVAPVAGDLWYPHVYQPNQSPTGGINPKGRFDYGPWVAPPTMVFNTMLPTTSIMPEAFMDTMVVNGKAYPYMEVGQKPMRFRILNASNDRTLNLQLYYATTGTGAFGPAPTYTPAAGVKCNSAAYPASQCTEVKMVPANGAEYKNVPLQYTPTGSGSVWAPFDNRPGGVPDPTFQGPPFIQIGTESGLMRTPVVHFMQPIDYEYDRKAINVLNIRNNPVIGPTGCPTCKYPFNGHSLLIGAGERADIVVDFTNVPNGSTLILYNDGPAATPAIDPRNDYFTGGADLSATGGYASPKKGFGPNTRTVMQFRVNARTKGVAPANAPNRKAGWVSVSDPNGGLVAPALQMATGAVATDLATTFDASVEPLLVGKCDPAKPATCATTKMCTYGTDCLTGVTEFPSCVGWYQNRKADLAAGIATDSNGAVIPLPLPAHAVNSENYGLANFRDGTAQGCGYPVMNKSIAEDFDPIFGRMNSKLGTEQAALNTQGQQTFGFYYADPTTEHVYPTPSVGQTPATNTTQIWNIVHNGVDSHTVHFHLASVQVVNRVDWAGVVKPATAAESGWKETVLMNPLENIVVAVKAKVPPVPASWGWNGPGGADDWSLAPVSKRPRDVTSPLSDNLISVANPNPNMLFPFTFQTDPVTQRAIKNEIEDYQFEYVWHCHILGHEENDMMRPFIVLTDPNYTPYPRQ